MVKSTSMCPNNFIIRNSNQQILVIYWLTQILMCLTSMVRWKTTIKMIWGFSGIIILIVLSENMVFSIDKNWHFSWDTAFKLLCIKILLFLIANLDRLWIWNAKQFNIVGSGVKWIKQNNMFIVVASVAFG